MPCLGLGLHSSYAFRRLGSPRPALCLALLTRRPQYRQTRASSRLLAPSCKGWEASLPRASPRPALRQWCRCHQAAQPQSACNCLSLPPALVLGMAETVSLAVAGMRTTGRPGRVTKGVSLTPLRCEWSPLRLVCLMLSLCCTDHSWTGLQHHRLLHMCCSWPRSLSFLPDLQSGNRH